MLARYARLLLPAAAGVVRAVAPRWPRARDAVRRGAFAPLSTAAPLAPAAAPITTNRPTQGSLLERCIRAFRKNRSLNYERKRTALR